MMNGHTMSEYTSLLYSVEQSIATISFNRPQARNALNRQMRLEFVDALERATRDGNVRAMIVAAEGPGFCAGVDLTEQAPDKDHEGWGTRQLRYEFNPIIHGVTTSEKPIISAVNGAAAGFGASLALCCDFTLMSEDAFIYSAFGAISLVPDGGLHKILLDYLSPKQVYELIAFSERISAKECAELGMANRVVANDALLSEATAFAQKLVSLAPLTLRYSKQLLREAKKCSLDEITEKEAFIQNICLQSEDFKEGMSAFFEKRKPEFKGK